MRDHWLIVRGKKLNISFRIHKVALKTFLGLGVITLATMIMNLVQGDYPISLIEVLRTIIGLNKDNFDYTFIVNEVRLPRTLVAFMVGMGLGISGAIVQGLTRNPLADPGIIGINEGAGLAGVTTLVMFPDANTFFLPISAFFGALTVAILIYWLAWNKGSSPSRLILIGVGIAAMASGLTSLMITLGEISNVSQALVWLAGSVYGRTWEQVKSLLPCLIIFVPLSLMQAKSLNLLNMGDDFARSLGSAVEWERGLLLLTSVSLASAAVASAGTIGFIGLSAPHLSRQLVGASHEGLIPVAGMIGGVIVVLADLLGRTLFAPLEIPCGVVTAVVGAPYFLYLLITNGKQ